MQRKFLTLHGFEFRPLGRPAGSKSLYQLHRCENLKSYRDVTLQFRSVDHSSSYPEGTGEAMVIKRPRLELAIHFYLALRYSFPQGFTEWFLNEPFFPTCNSVSMGLHCDTVVVFRRLWLPHKRSYKGPRGRQVREMPRPLRPLWPADRRQVLAREWATEQ